MASIPRPVILCIFDGFGIRAQRDANAVLLARTPNLARYLASCPYAQLEASEGHVGLPAGQMGNSEVGHMNLGAGRVVLQDLPRIDAAIANKLLVENQTLQHFIAGLKASKGTAHLLGLVSDGGVHAQQRHAVALAEIISAAGVPVAIHAFLDGRDVPPQSAAATIAALQRSIAPLPGVRLATLCGRYYAMDRDNRWERVEKAYRLIVNGEGSPADDAQAAIQASYAAGIHDEFFLPVALNHYAGVQAGDGLLMANFRSDRARQLLQALLDPAFTGFPRPTPPHFAATAGMVAYSDLLNPYCPALFAPHPITHTLGEVVSRAGLKQLRLAETEKYPHVTFFFNGGAEAPYAGEDRILIPSPKVATYDLQPEMAAVAVTDALVAAIEQNTYDFIVVNYANGDMVGHSGLLEPAIKAVEVLDACIGRVEAAVKKQGGLIMLTADHGNCEKMQDGETGAPHTAHTLNPVPLLVINPPKSVTGLQDGVLADVAPTLLHCMGIAVPAEMTGKNLSLAPRTLERTLA